MVTGQRHRKTEFEYLLKEDSFKLYIVDFLHAKLHAYFTILCFSFLATIIEKDVFPYRNIGF